MTPASAAAALAGLRILRAEPELVGRLWANARRLHEGFERLGLPTLPEPAPILPVFLDDDGAAAALSAAALRARRGRSAGRCAVRSGGHLAAAVIATAAHSPATSTRRSTPSQGRAGAALDGQPGRCFDHKSQINDCSGADRPGGGAACRLSPEHHRPRRDRSTGAGPLSVGQNLAGAGSHEDVVVIGAGAVGVCCAYFLARAGRSVRVLERDRICSGSSWGNSGLVTTSSCTPEPHRA
jgi:hypothetical protein